ncbi:LysM peptidoglycan-binding domain-containing protein [Caulobacter hibisci]|uniref:LysM peptidoglycan-binding domain-containing protein n=1 Tax=Caulobacter hibisci TaxID=2035993 RepID=A0ABS0SST6_9CAUL|nr:LysM domain-containing protein [Caulobacter hibisci]MBI1682712.1 LysM peptidoglycan-binding domain-containing protein [Caulobacter hibisci]
MTAVSLNTQSSVSGSGGGGRSNDYVVKSGDTLSGIAEKHGVSLEAVIRANPQIANPNAIRPGQAVTLPTGAAAEARSYTVASGDNLSNIGAQFGVSWQALAQANGLTNPNLIHVGQALQIPGGGTAAPAATAQAATPTTSGQATGVLPSTEGLSQAQKYALYSGYVNAYGDAQAKADLAAGKQVILGLRTETSLSANGGKGAYDDRVVVLQQGGQVREFAASTEPSVQYDGRYGADFDGDGRKELGRIAEGTVTFQKSTSSTLGDVLRPTGSHAVQRDTNHDGRIDARDARGTGVSTDNSFLFHAGGNGNTGSAGCQTLKPADFQAFWSGLSDQKSFNYVLVNVDRQGPPGTVTAATPASDDARIGALSERYETGGRGPGTVSSGTGDPGGVSYGTYQLAGNRNRPQEFLAAEGRAWAAEFGGAAPGSASFTATWKAIAAREPERFEAAQHDYIQRTHYQVQLDTVSAATGLDLSTRSSAIRDVVWSTSVQHGPETGAIVKAMARVEGQGLSPADGQAYDRALINAVYDERGKRDAGGGLAYFTSASASVQASVANRFASERRDALAMLGQ